MSFGVRKVKSVKKIVVWHFRFLLFWANHPCPFYGFLGWGPHFSGIHSDTSNPTYIISVFDTKSPWPYIRINDSTISRILKHQWCYELCCFPFWQGSLHLQMYFMALTHPMQQFVLHSQFTTSMIAWDIGSKVIMTGISSSPSYLTPTKIHW